MPTLKPLAPETEKFGALSIVDAARRRGLANVSRTTVSVILQRQPGAPVAPETRRRVLEGQQLLSAQPDGPFDEEAASRVRSAFWCAHHTYPEFRARRASSGGVRWASTRIGRRLAMSLVRISGEAFFSMTGVRRAPRWWQFCSSDCGEHDSFSVAAESKRWSRSLSLAG